MALGSFPLGVPKEKSPGGFVSPAGSETPGVRPSVLSAQGPQLESLSSGRPCRTPTGKGQGQRRWEAWHVTPPRGVHCTENSSVKGPVTPNLCIPRDHCRALSCLTSHSLQTALGRAARALTTGVSGSRARPVPCCLPWAISREEGACHTCGAAPADSRTVSSSRGCCAAGLASQAERGRGPWRRGGAFRRGPLPSGEGR